MEANLEIKYIFTNVSDWLKYAETMHAGLIVLNSGLIIGIILGYNNFLPFIYTPTVLIGMICFTISFLISIISRFPVTPNIFYNKKNILNPNLYFFEDLSEMDNQTFVEELRKVDKDFSPSKLDTDLIIQVLINFRIPQSKYNLFKFAGYLTGFSSGLIGVASIIKVL